MKKGIMLLMSLLIVFSIVIVGCSDGKSNKSSSSSQIVSSSGQTSGQTSGKNESTSKLTSGQTSEPTSEQTSEPTSEQASEPTSEQTSEPTESEPDVMYSEMIPDPNEIFKNGEIAVIDKDGGKAYIFQVRNYTDEEYQAYVSGCKELGFTDISYETENEGGKMFGAYTSDGEYWVQVLSGNETGILAVTCKKSTK